MSSTSLKVLDLFSGIGGFAKGLHEVKHDKYKFETVAFCEIDNDCHKVLAKHYPTVPIFDDVTTLTKDKLMANGIPKIDYIVGGFPCFVGDTQVLTSEGYEDIQDIKAGALVLTHKGNWKRVTGVSQKVYHGLIYKIKLSNKSIVRCTENHPFYVQGHKWVQAKDLNRHLHRLGSIDIPNTGKYSIEAIDWSAHSSELDFDDLMEIANNRDAKKYLEERKERMGLYYSSFLEGKTLIMQNVARREFGFTPYIDHVYDTYRISGVKTPKYQRSYVRENNYTWSDIINIETTNKSGNPITVYNLNVEDDESYVVYDVIVHNCQDISIGGKKKGFYDENGNRTRSGLWEEYRRLIGEIQPEGVIIENVENLRELGLSTVLKDLTDLGYDSEWGVFTARDTANLPHQRQRLYIVSYPRGQRFNKRDGLQCEVQIDEEWKDKDSKKIWERCKSKPLSFRPIFSKRSIDDFRNTYPYNHASVSSVHRVTHGIPSELHKGNFTTNRKSCVEKYLVNLGANFSSEGIELSGVQFPKVVLANKSYCIVEFGGVETAIEVPHTTETDATLYEQVELACILHDACVTIDELVEATGIDAFDLIDLMQTVSESKRETRIKQLGNSIVPQIAKYIGERILDAK